jgi:hypothetical protein
MIRLALLLLLAAPLHAKPRAPRPEADALLLKALAGPATSYTAVERVQVFLPGKKPKAMTIAVSALPGGKVRLASSAGRRKAPGPVELRLEDEPAAKGLARLRSLYELSVSTGGAVAKRKTWKVELRLKSNGSLRRIVWVDRDSGLLMKRETYRADGSLARRERLSKLALPAAVDPALLSGAAARKPWAPAGFFPAAGGAFTNGLESYKVEGGRVTGDLAEDDAARVLESAGR